MGALRLDVCIPNRNEVVSVVEHQNLGILYCAEELPRIPKLNSTTPSECAAGGSRATAS